MERRKVLQTASMNLGGAPDFSSYAAERAANFQAREWVFAEIEAWMSDPDGPRYYLVTGEPGSGKTAIAARLTQLSTEATEANGARLSRGFLSAAFFCSARDSSLVDPRSFANSIAAQLAAAHEEFRLALTKVGDKDIHIDVRMEIGTALGNSKVTGMDVRTLDLSGLRPQEAFNRSVLDPLHAVYASGFDKPIIILVDALDESIVHVGDVGIVDLISRVETLSPKVKFILTSRPDEKIENRLNAVRGLSLSATEFSSRWSADMQHFIRWRVSQSEKLKQKVVSLGQEQASTFVTTAAERADANFLYGSFLLGEMERGDRSIEDFERLPDGLDLLYYESLERLISSSGKTWSEYSPLLGVLSVALESLTLDELRSMLGLSERAAWELTGDLRQLIEEVLLQDQAGNTRYRLYHQSVVDYLRKPNIAIKERTLRNRYYLPAEEWHQHLRNHYRRGASSWGKVDWSKTTDYGVLYIASHISRACADRSDLYELICKPFMRQKLERFTALLPVAEDVALAIAAAAAEQPVNLVEEIRLSLIYSMLVSLAGRVVPEALGLLAELGRVDESRGFAQLISSPEKQSRAYLLIGEALLRHGQQDAAKLLLENALVAARRIGLASTRSEVLGPLAAALARAGEKATFRVLKPDDLRDDETRTGALEGLAEAAAVAKDTDGLDQILAEVRRLPNGASRAGALARVSLGVAASGNHAAARDFAEEAMREASELTDEMEYVRALCLAVRAFARAGDKSHSVRINERVMQSAFRASAAWPGELLLVDVIRAIDSCDDQSGLASAFDYVERLPVDRRKAWVVGIIADSAARLGSPDTFRRAVSMLKAIAILPEGSEESAHALACWARALAISGDARGLMHLISAARVMGANWYGSRALEGVAQALAEVREFDLALDLAQEISIEAIKADVLIAIARAMVGANQRQTAISTVSRTLGSQDLMARWVKAEALCSFASACARVGRTADAANIARAALSVMEPLLDDFFYLSHTAGVLVQIARAFVEAGDFEGLNRVVELASGLQNGAEKTRALTRTGLALANIGEREHALRILTLAEASIQGTTDPEDRAINLAEIARAFALSRMTTQAALDARWAQNEAKAVDSERKRGKALSFAARAMAEAGMGAEAIAVANEVMTIARSPSLVWEEKSLGLGDRRGMLLNVATALAAADRVEAALEVIDEIEQPWDKAWTIADVGEVLAKRDRWVSAAPLLAKARAIDELFARVRVLAKLAGVSARSGDIKSAMDAVRNAQVAASGIEDDHSRAEALGWVAEALATAGQKDEALMALRSALAAARSSGMHAVYNTLNQGALTLAAVDDGRMLVRAFEATGDVDTWMLSGG